MLRNFWTFTYHRCLECFKVDIIELSRRKIEFTVASFTTENLQYWYLLYQKSVLDLFRKSSNFIFMESFGKCKWIYGFFCKKKICLIQLLSTQSWQISLPTRNSTSCLSKYCKIHDSEPLLPIKDIVLRSHFLSFLFIVKLNFRKFIHFY